MTSHRAKITVHFEGGPWHGRSATVRTVTAPVFSVGNTIGRDYWLDTKSDPPTYRWHAQRGRADDQANP